MPGAPGRVDLQRLTGQTAAGEVTPLGANNSPGTAQYLYLNTQVSAPWHTQGAFTLPPGNWYVRVLSLDTVIPAEPFTVRVAVAAGSRTAVKVLNHAGVEDDINYGYGYSWRMQTSATFQGIWKDRYGRVLPNTPVNLAVYTRRHLYHCAYIRWYPTGL
ncbi:hypothetical protein [Stigmatella aurantiaca]|uniref:Conserved uncharacterized protein n=1 Tax=Stigmatella aurantiaca (strain DW4/3-1) TaxID=378806 RepID=Q09A71_STIAD|nr:hypothetical protein [Stigmatella aurantiaca]ADO75076.1 conserved uncharacterized protein [Stigmatella aurantiaca DW4/3-1]EAU68673.1 hypothetical protein STIAU_6056 [Stigmatella aurantiaca DW4/3-1]